VLKATSTQVFASLRFLFCASKCFSSSELDCTLMLVREAHWGDWGGDWGEGEVAGAGMLADGDDVAVGANINIRAVGP
jgi:hypothetical protein